jgi:riboflavin synthase
MFTGIITDLGKIKKIASSNGGKIFKIHAPKTCRGLKIGDSVAINGACHTVIQKTSQTFTVESMPETLKRTNFGQFKIDTKINLERPLKVSSRLDGHFVSGHIDGVAKIFKITTDQNSKIFEFELPQKFSKFLVEKGSIALDGISLTIIKVIKNKFTVGIIPHTLRVTNFGKRKINEQVNFEIDLLAKQVAKLFGKF